MATLIELDEKGLVARFDPELGPSEQEVRCAYFMPRAIQFIENALPQLVPRWVTEIDPLEQFDALLALWARGEPIAYDHQFKPLEHLGDGIWEFKTHDLRIFGWFTSLDCFVCSAIADATHVKEHELYYGFAQQAVRDRDTLPLDEPKFVEGADPNGVVSNFYYPEPKSGRALRHRGKD